jgi:hypothetical protein
MIKPDSSAQNSKSDEGSSINNGYTAQKDIIVNIYFNNSYVNGDAREIALSIEQELVAAHVLGY